MKNYSNSSTIYVSQKIGNDLFSGFTKEINGFGDGPIKTLNRALEMINSMRICNVFKPITVKIMDDLFISSTIEIKENENNICFESLNNKVRIIGGQKITGFKKDKLNGFDCVSIYLDQVKNGLWNFTDLYVNGKRANLARYPKNEFLKAERTEYPTTNEAFKPSTWFIAEKNSLDQIDDLEHCILSFCHYFIDEHTPIESYDKATRKVTLKYSPCMTMNTNYDKVDSSSFYYYLENTKKGFTEQNDWFLDVKNGKLYYFPAEEDDVDSLEFFAPQTNSFFSIEGNIENKVKNITFRNIAFTCSKGDYVGKNKNNGNGLFASDEQSWAYAFGAMRFTNATNCSIYNCDFYALGLHAIELTSGCHNVRIENCNIHDIGGGGIKVCGAKYGEPKESECSHNVFRNNHIYNCGQRYYASCGILICHSSNNEISFNQIHDVNYTGISVGWVWGYADSNTYANLIKCNHVYRIGMGPLSDMGAIYLLGKQPGTVVQSNIVHDVLSKHGGTYGLYADEGTSYATFENNVVYNTTLASMHVHLGNENVIKNNVFAFGKLNIINVSMRENHEMALFENNVFVADTEKIYGNSYADILYPNPSFYSDNNLIISLNKKAVLTKIGQEATKIYFDKWKSIFGLDKNSSVVIYKQNLHKYFESLPDLIERIGVEQTIVKVLKKFNRY